MQSNQHVINIQDCWKTIPYLYQLMVIDSMPGVWRAANTTKVGCFIEPGIFLLVYTFLHSTEFTLQFSSTKSKYCQKRKKNIYEIHLPQNNPNQVWVRCEYKM